MQTNFRAANLWVQLQKHRTFVDFADLQQSPHQLLSKILNKQTVHTRTVCACGNTILKKINAAKSITMCVCAWIKFKQKGKYACGKIYAFQMRERRNLRCRHLWVGGYAEQPPCKNPASVLWQVFRDVARCCLPRFQGQPQHLKYQNWIFKKIGRSRRHFLARLLWWHNQQAVRGLWSASYIQL